MVMECANGTHFLAVVV